MTPTLFANQLYPTLREMLERFSQTFELFSSRSGLFNGRTITIGMSDDFELAMGSDMVELAKRIPTCTRLRFVQTNSVLVEEMLLSRSIDLAVTSGGTRSDSVCSVEVGSGNYGCLIDPNTFGTADWNLETYVDRGHILVSSGGYYGLVDEILSSLGKKRRVLVSTSHFSAIPALLTGTNALTTIPRHAAAAITKFSALKLLEPPIRFPNYPVNLSWRNYSRKDPVLLELIEIFSSNLKSCLFESAGN
ncbi:LysR substrate-binding domain-containing protein [uncultured Parasutterella sp.]|uniref:LysR substrate-binding domain-containing protein n=1 Tax=uncultured Parasutterella sp. TaxID=1263098 RepID=UPI002592717B|nr:LysR substrate-binding domain-containing protein [uncultured Parasutterella sp.]